jgi:hypothetical protein
MRGPLADRSSSTRAHIIDYLFDGASCHGVDGFESSSKGFECAEVDL